MIATITFAPTSELGNSQATQDPTAVIKTKAKAASEKFAAMFLNSMFQQMFTAVDGGRSAAAARSKSGVRF